MPQTVTLRPTGAAPDPIRLNAEVFAATYAAVSCGWSDDKTVAVELFETGARLYASDYSLIVVGWVPLAGWTLAESTQPEPDEAPVAVLRLVDGDQLVLKAAKFARSNLKDRAKNHEMIDEVAVTVTAVPATPDLDRPLLDESLAPLECLVEYDDIERVRVPLTEYKSPDWRAWANPIEKATGRTLVGPETLADLAAVGKAVASPSRIMFYGPVGAAHIRYPMQTRSAVWAVFMPMDPEE